MKLVLAEKEKTGEFLLMEKQDVPPVLVYREIFPDKKSSIMKKHSSVFYATETTKFQKGKQPKESKIYLDNDNVEATMDILKYCVTDWKGIFKEDQKTEYTKSEITGAKLYNLLDQTGKLDEFVDLVSGNEGETTTKN